MSVYSMDGNTNISSGVGSFDASKIQSSGGGGDGFGALLAFSKGMSSFGEAQEYQGMATSLDYQADYLGLQAEQVLVTSDIVTKRMEEQGKKVSGTQMALYAKSGVTFEGSPMLVYAESEKNIRHDILLTRLNYVQEANRLGFAGLNKKIQAGIARTRAVQKYGEGVLNMATSAYSSGLIGGS
ncbi:MAG: hypothetical protein U9O94_10675 [Nanoarchaeota archaeon]|nr:hypothetical protein [Nanoarchaeota archaeon]